jgi:hypothetical protein
MIWVGHRGPNIYTASLPPNMIDELNGYVHGTTNLLVDSRMSLFVIYPGLPVNGPVITASEMEAGIDIGDDNDPFSGDINFGVFVNETGGNLFYNRNDVNTEIKQSEEWGSEYYTLTYQPLEGNPDGKFRRIRVTLRKPDLRVVTKAGNFSPDKNAAVGPRQQTMVNISEAARSTIPFESLGVTIDNLVRHPDTRTVEFTVVLSPRNLDWQPGDDGKSSLDLSLAAASLSGNRDFLASRVESLTVTTNDQDATLLARTEARLPMTIRIPRKTQSVRVVVQTAGNGRVGTVELDRKSIDNAREAPTPEPKLIPQSQKPPSPPTALRP